MKKRTLIVLHYIIQFSIAQISASNVYVDSLAARVERFGTGLPQEKVYLHIDNTCYCMGDTIWYKAYVTRSDKGWLTDLRKSCTWNSSHRTDTSWNGNS